MIKQQIIMDIDRIRKDGQYDPDKIQQYLDDFMTQKIGFVKSDDGFYIGKGSRDDFARAGFAMTALRRKDWFMKYVDTWLHFNSDDADNPDDFAIEDFKAFNMTQYGISA
jgi:hypothetical protein